MTELKETTALMESDDYKKRFAAEYLQIRAMADYIAVLEARAQIENINLWRSE